MKRVFAAIDISEDVREEIRNYIAGLGAVSNGDPVKWEKPEKLHITVNFAGAVDESQLEAFGEQVQAVASSLTPFRMRIAATGAFLKRRGPSVLWLGTEVVSAADDPFAVLAGLSEKRTFRPHLTIARIKDPRTAKDMIERHKKSVFESVSFDVSELVIYESTLLTTGSIYSKLADYPLG